MPRDFSVTLDFFTAANKRVKWNGVVTSVPGEDIFRTARRVCAKRARKGVPARMLRASMVPA